MGSPVRPRLPEPPRPLAKALDVAQRPSGPVMRPVRRERPGHHDLVEPPGENLPASHRLGRRPASVHLGAGGHEDLAPFGSIVAPPGAECRSDIRVDGVAWHLGVDTTRQMGRTSCQPFWRTATVILGRTLRRASSTPSSSPPTGRGWRVSARPPVTMQAESPPPAAASRTARSALPEVARERPTDYKPDGRGRTWFHDRRVQKPVRVPQALQQQLKSLEEEVGTQLLKRSRTGCSPTAAGKVLYDGLRNLAPQFEALLAETRKAGEERGASVLVAGTNLINDPLYYNALADFTHLHGGIRVGMQ